MEQKVNSKMIILARESRGMNQGELASKMGISQGKISKVEQDFLPATTELVQKLSTVLNYPESFFYQQGELFRPNMFYRKRLSITQKILSKLEADMNVYRLNIQQLLKSTDLPDNIPVVDEETEKTPAEIARYIRQYWRIPKGPIQNLTKILEDNGIIVVRCSFDTIKVDGLTILTDRNRPIIFINKNILGDRERFTLAHELGHLIMHTFSMVSYDRDVEIESDGFASEFLMPEADIKFQLKDNLNVARLADLKRIWKVSMSALLVRAKTLGVISDNQYRYLFMQFGTLGIRKREPMELDVPIEKSSLLDEILKLYKKELNYDDNEIAKLMHLSNDEYRQKYTDNQLPFRVLK